MNKKILAILLISIFLISMASTAVAKKDDKYYSIGPANLFLKIEDNGLIKVQETYNYTFEGQFNGVYRDIPLKDGESIENLVVTAEGAYTTVDVKNYGDKYHIKVYLYSDPAKTKPIKDTDVLIHYSYDFKNVVKIYNDVGEFQYQIWGSEWDKSVSNLTAKIQFPENQKLEYWINPIDSETTETWDGNTLIINSPYVLYDSYLEFRGIIPLSEFKNPTYVKKINDDGYDDIVKTQNDYVNGKKLESEIITLIPYIFTVSLVIPVFLYFRYGREPKVTYDKVYEHDLPEELPPIYVNAMYSRKSDVGKVSNEGIQATIMELINDDIIKIISNEDKNLKLQLPEEYSSLESYKQRIINDLLKPFAVDNILDFDVMKKYLLKETVAKKFNEDLKDIKFEYSKSKVQPVLDTYFDKKGSSYFRIYSIILAMTGFISMIISLVWDPLSLDWFFASLLYFIVGCFIFIIPNRIFGKWTKEGILEFKKWDAFNKYIKDFSLIKEHPPESVAMWNKYLVYATALGNAKAVNKAMQTIGPVTDYSSLYLYSHHGGPALFESAIKTSFSSDSSSSGVGGVGGGSGGGGGGAF